MNKTIVPIAMILAAAAGQAAAQQLPPITVQPLSGGIYVVKGGDGANTGFVVGKTQVIAIDAKTAEASAEAVLAEIKKVTPNPVKYMLVTHSDADHVNGISAFPLGMRIVSAGATRKDMETAFEDLKLVSRQPYLPTQEVTDSRTLTIDGVKVNLYFFGPAHTSGDMVILFPEQKVAFVGDLVAVGRDPLIHRAKGGNSAGLVEVLNKVLALDAETYVCGHSDPLTKADVRAAVSSIEQSRAKVAALVKEGKSLDEVKAAMGVPAGAARFPSLAEVVYREQTER